MLLEELSDPNKLEDAPPEANIYRILVVEFLFLHFGLNVLYTNHFYKWGFGKFGSYIETLI